MILRSFALLAFCTMMGVAAPLYAKSEKPSEFRQIKDGELTQLRPDRGYLLLRIDTNLSKFTANILRVPSQDEIDEYESAKLAAHAKAGKKAAPLESFAFIYEGRPNFFELDSKKPIVSTGKISAIIYLT